MDRVTATISLGALLLVGAAAFGSARGDEFPPRKAGLWQIDMAMPGGQMPPQQMKMCIDPATDAEMYKLGMNASRGIVRRAGHPSERKHGHRRHGLQDGGVAGHHAGGDEVHRRYRLPHRCQYEVRSADGGARRRRP